eukprot:TRINITY_DN12075_c0_g1_i6.p1 TRINITY_DN12075_c0_g1~~TRINITY_DN12075_c0_g1_i6.p1  ORF type:complete len:479 (+),score=112.03 TRINITY_DN12075_c0_g1_i6:209-1645(+)
MIRNRLLVYGGITQRGYLERFQVLNPACNPGYDNLAVTQTHEPCRPCNTTEFWASFDQGCLACPTGLQRSTSQVMTQEACDTCVDNYCQGHGSRCEVTQDGGKPQASCRCGSLLRGPQCQINDRPVLLGVLFGSLTVIAILIFGWRTYKGGMRKGERLLEQRDLEIEMQRKQIDELIGRWRLSKQQIQYEANAKPLGEGALGTVVLARLQPNDRLVAVKRVREVLSEADLFGDNEEEKQLAAEVDLLQSMKHNHKTFPELSWPLRRSLVMGIAQGMEYLHETMQRIHRDLKADNVLVNGNMQVKITDFDKARRFQPDGMQLPSVDVHADVGDGTTSLLRRLTRFSRSSSQASLDSQDDGIDKDAEATLARMTTAVGTREWTAVELLRSNAGYVRYGKAVDVYSYGIVLWEVATRELPYADMDMAMMTLTRKIVGPENLRPTLSKAVPLEWQELMRECWDSNAKNRPTFTELLQILQEW